MKLITEQVLDISYITEGDGDKKSMFIHGIYAQAEIANKNRRIYPLSVLQNEVTRYVNENVNGGRAYGELGHPIGPNINLDRACILIKEMKQSGNDFIGKSLVLSTPMGEVVRGLINDGCKLGVSTRALGSLKEKNGLNEVQSDLRLLAVDVVADPSAPKAYVNGIMEEKSYIWDASRQCYLEEYVDREKGKIEKMTMREIEEKQVRMFADFLNRLGAYYQ